MSWGTKERIIVIRSHRRIRPLDSTHIFSPASSSAPSKTKGVISHSATRGRIRLFQPGPAPAQYWARAAASRNQQTAPPRARDTRQRRLLSAAAGGDPHFPCPPFRVQRMFSQNIKIVRRTWGRQGLDTMPLFLPSHHLYHSSDLKGQFHFYHPHDIWGNQPEDLSVPIIPPYSAFYRWTCLQRGSLSLLTAHSYQSWSLRRPEATPGQTF